MEIRKSGMISIVGRPNVGKSTLTNALVGEKIAIVTNKPQTTRNRICAVVNREGCQFVFLDTPGLHKARTRLGDYMVKVVKESVADVDAVLLLVEPIPHIGGPEAELIRRGAPALPGGHGHRPAGTPGVRRDHPGEAAALPGQGNSPRHRRGDHHLFRAGRRYHRPGRYHLL